MKYDACKNIEYTEKNVWLKMDEMENFDYINQNSRLSYN